MPSTPRMPMPMSRSLQSLLRLFPLLLPPLPVASSRVNEPVAYLYTLA